jgi:hypothetical protein
VGFLVVAIFAAAPLVALGADNGRLVGPADLAPYYAGLVLPSLALVALVAWRWGRAAANTVAACTAIAIVVAFDYWDMRPGLSALTHDSRPAMVFLWFVVLLAALWVVTRLARRVPELPLLLLVAGLAWLVPSMFSWANEHAEQPGHVRAAHADTGRRLTDHFPPNVYFFMLDAYARADHLREQFGFDNSRFLNGLRSKGFVIPPRSETTYGITLLSVPTMFEMRPVITHGMLRAESVNPIMAGHNAVADTFRTLGYSIAWAPSQLPDWDCDGSEDRCIRATQTYQSHLGVSQLAWAVMERTPVADAMRSIKPVHLNPLTARRQFPLRVARVVAERRSKHPVFTFAHVLLTHWPYLYLGPRCRLAAVRGKLGAAAYIQAVECANANTQAAIGTILDRDPDAVIVLASDHGSDVDIDGTRPAWIWSRRDVARRYSNFVALRLPRRCRAGVPARLFTANIFRVVLNCLAEPDLPMLQPARYLSSQLLEVRRDPAFSRRGGR